MAVNFLVLSESYVTRYLRTDFGRLMLGRRSIVVRYLTPTYEFTTDMRRLCLTAVRQEFPDTDFSPIDFDAENYRIAFLYLNGTPAQRAHIQIQVEGNQGTTRGLRYLLADHIETWGDIERLLNPEETSLVSVLKPVPQTIISSLPSPISHLSSSPYKERMEKEIKRLADQIRKHGELIIARDSEIATLRRRLDKVEEEFHGLNEHPHRESQKPRSLAGGQQTEIASQLQKIDPASDIIQLPTETANGGQIIPRSRFKHFFGSLTPGEQQQVVKAVEILVSQGPSSPSLRTTKYSNAVPGTPPDSMVSRASRQLRFAWKQSDDDLIFYSGFRKGTKRFHRSER